MAVLLFSKRAQGRSLCGFCLKREELAVFIVMPKKRRMPAHIKKLNKARQDAKLADAKAAAAKQATQLTAAPPDPPPAASSEAKPSSSSSLPHSIEENLVVPTPQIGSGSTDTASSAPGAAAQPKALLGCPNKRGRGKYDHNREQPKPRPHERRAAETLKQAEQAFEDQKTLTEATTGVWEEMEQALSDAAQFRKQHAAKCADDNLHLRMPGTPTKNRALSEPPSQGNSPAELAVLVLVPAICPRM